MTINGRRVHILYVCHIWDFIVMKVNESIKRRVKNPDLCLYVHLKSLHVDTVSEWLALVSGS